jgi:hypothetical protein
MKNEIVTQMLDRLQLIHDRKNEDYTSKHPDENFMRSQEIQSWFSNDIDKPYAVLIGTKIARLATLLSKDGPPNNESIEDSFDDLAMYCILWASRRKRIKRDQMISELGKSTSPLGIAPIT